jgi:dihydroorotate dehydrogenase (fumarate)
VLFSLFEEQLRREALEYARLLDAGTETFAESLSYLPAAADTGVGPQRYLNLLERAAGAVDIPVIGSLNGITADGWGSYARSMQDAGAAAIELNIYYLPADSQITGRDVEQRHVDILTRVKDHVTVPVAVKLSPQFSSPGEIAVRLDRAGADALVLFNRFLQPDIDPDTLAVTPTMELSTPVEARLPRTWIAILHGRVNAALAATTGVEGADRGDRRVPHGERAWQ